MLITVYLSIFFSRSNALCCVVYSYFEKEKVHANILKGIVGGFEFTVSYCSSKKFERITLEAMIVCLRVLKESNKIRFDSYSVRNRVY